MKYLQNYFEQFFTVAAMIFGIILLMYIILKIRDYSWKKHTGSLVNKISMAVVTVGELILIIVLGLVYWVNYQQPAKESLALANIIPHTQWVKDDIKIYYISNNILNSINAKGDHFETIYEAKDPIRAYHFSPDGAYLLISTAKELFLYDITQKIIKTIDAVDPKGNSKGTISGVRWAPDSRRVVYEISRWSRFASQDYIYIYDRVDSTKEKFQSPTRRISSLYWDKAGEHLYYFDHEADDPNAENRAHRVKVIRISLPDFETSLVTSFMTNQTKPSIANLEFRDINLYVEGDRHSFGLEHTEDQWVADNGAVLGIDEKDHLYFIKNKWFKRRLYKVTRIPREGSFPRYQYQGGSLAIEGLLWLPGGQYVIMRHRAFGILILEPSSAQIGVLMETKGRAFGFYSP